jgi:AcrR family transcriptional regulator
MTALLNPSPRSLVAQRILAAATKVLAVAGEAGLKIDIIMRSAEVKAPVIYRHFGSREGLVQSAHLARFLEVMQLESALFDAAARRAISAEEFRSAFLGLVDSMLSEERRTANLARLEVLSMGISRPELAEAIRDAQNSVLHRTLPALELAQDQGWIRTDIEPIAFMAWAISGTVGRAMVTRFHPELDASGHWGSVHRRALVAVLFGDGL